MQLENNSNLTLQQSYFTSVPQFRIESRHHITEDIYRALLSREQFSLTGNCLDNHAITPERRSKMVDWMIEVLAQYQTSGQTFFLAVKIMDKFFQLSQTSFSNSKLHLIGVVSMFIASKFEDTYALRLSIVYEEIGHRLLTEKSIRKMEQEILKSMKFDIGIPNCSDFLGYMCEVLNPSLAVRRTAEMIVVLLQIYYNTGLKPSQEATAALIIATRSLRQDADVKKILSVSGYSESDMEFVSESIHKEILQFSNNYASFLSATKFLRFSLILNVPGPLFQFEDHEVQANQVLLLTNFK